jgi:hypothetical protein
MKQPFTALDWIGSVATAAMIVALMALPLGGFREMFRDLGGTETLPALTRLALLPGFTLVLALPAIASLAVGLRSARGLSHQRKWIAAAFVLACLGQATCVVAMYLPIFSIAGKIKAD